MVPLQNVECHDEGEIQQLTRIYTMHHSSCYRPFLAVVGPNIPDEELAFSQQRLMGDGIWLIHYVKHLVTFTNTQRIIFSMHLLETQRILSTS